VIRLGCGRFWKLSYRSRDHELTPGEQRFVDRHRNVCRRCAAEEARVHHAFSELQKLNTEPRVSADFDTRTLWSTRAVRRGAMDWSPAIVGASVAAFAVLAILQILRHSSELPTLRPTRELGSNQLSMPLVPELKARSSISVDR